MLASIPNYYLFLFMNPLLIANRIEARFRKILRNDLDEQRRFHLVNWSVGALEFRIFSITIKLCSINGLGGLGRIMIVSGGELMWPSTGTVHSGTLGRSVEIWKSIIHKKDHFKRFC